MVIFLSIGFAFLPVYMHNNDISSAYGQNTRDSQHINPYLRNAKTSITGIVKYTLVLSTTSLLNGKFLNHPDGTVTFSVTYNPANTHMCVTNSGSDNVSVINGTINKVVDAINVGCYPRDVVYDPVTSYMYVSDFNTHNISVINSITNKVIYTIGVGSRPFSLVYNSANSYMYVTNKHSSSISVINSITKKVIHTNSPVSDPSDLAYNSVKHYICHNRRFK